MRAGVHTSNSPLQVSTKRSLGIDFDLDTCTRNYFELALRPGHTWGENEEELHITSYGSSGDINVRVATLLDTPVPVLTANATEIANTVRQLDIVGSGFKPLGVSTAHVSVSFIAENGTAPMGTVVASSHTDEHLTVAFTELSEGRSSLIRTFTGKLWAVVTVLKQTSGAPVLVGHITQTPSVLPSSRKYVLSSPSISVRGFNLASSCPEPASVSISNLLETEFSLSKCSFYGFNIVLKEGSAWARLPCQLRLYAYGGWAGNISVAQLVADSASPAIYDEDQPPPPEAPRTEVYEGDLRISIVAGCLQIFGQHLPTVCPTNASGLHLQGLTLGEHFVASLCKSDSMLLRLLPGQQWGLPAQNLVVTSVLGVAQNTTVAYLVSSVVHMNVISMQPNTAMHLPNTATELHISGSNLLPSNLPSVNRVLGFGDSFVPHHRVHITFTTARGAVPRGVVQLETFTASSLTVKLSGLRACTSGELKAVLHVNGKQAMDAVTVAMISAPKLHASTAPLAANAELLHVYGRDLPELCVSDPSEVRPPPQQFP